MSTCADNEMGMFLRDIGASSDFRDCQYVVLSGAEYHNVATMLDSYSSGEMRRILEAYASGDFNSQVSVGGGSVDAVQAGQIFIFFFGVTVSLWFLAKSIGVVLSAIRKF
jgi:hypothetical protein